MKIEPTPNSAPFCATKADWEEIERSTPQDYDGHTGFDRMSPAERLEWLDGAVMFFVSHTRVLPKRWQLPETITRNP